MSSFFSMYYIVFAPLQTDQKQKKNDTNHPTTTNLQPPPTTHKPPHTALKCCTPLFWFYAAIGCLLDIMHLQTI